MAFWGAEFVYRGRSCREFGLEMYEFGRSSSANYKFTSTGKQIEDSTARRYSVFHYGAAVNEPHSFTLMFGPTMDRIDRHQAFDRFEVEKIAAWLTGWQDYGWLHIIQPDMEEFRYKCVVSDLQVVYQGQEPWCFEASIYCDSPFGYTLEETKEWVINGTYEINYYNRSTYNGYYKPVIEVDFASGAHSLIIINGSDNDRMTQLTPLAGGLSVRIDNQNEIITDKTSGTNLYPYFNFNYLRLKRGDNALSVTVNGTFRITSSFPVNIGG